MQSYEDKKISEFKNGDKISGYFYIKESEMKITTSNNKYMNFTLSDKTGDINAKLWDWDEDNPTRYRSGILVKVKGSVLDWQGQVQFKIDTICKVLESDGIKIDDYIPSAPYSAGAMLDYIYKTIDKISDSDLKALTSTIIDENKEAILIAPAAKKNHHALRSGLLYHVTSMLRSGISLSSIYSFLNKDLLYTGIILHDIGKLREMNVNECGIVDDYTTEGNLLGHIVEGIVMVDNVGQRLGTDPEKLLLVKHMILSHHYIPEHGSPKPPCFPEAEMLHYLDILDSRMFDMQKAYDSTQKGEFSERIWSLENRTIYVNTVF